MTTVSLGHFLFFAHLVHIVIVALYQVKPARLATFVMPTVNPAILVWARETAGLTRQEAVRKIGIGDSRDTTAVDKLAALERGDKDPTRPVLLKMVRQYRRPLLTFYLPSRRVRGTGAPTSVRFLGRNPAR